MSPRPM